MFLTWRTSLKREETAEVFAAKKYRNRSGDLQVSGDWLAIQSATTPWHVHMTLYSVHHDNLQADLNDIDA